MKPPLIGRNSEIDRLRNSVRQRESLLVLGPAGSGKTCLVRAIVEQDFIYLKYSHIPHQLLTDLASVASNRGTGAFLALRGRRATWTIGYPGNPAFI